MIHQKESQGRVIRFSRVSGRRQCRGMIDGPLDSTPWPGQLGVSDLVKCQIIRGREKMTKQGARIRDPKIGDGLPKFGSVHVSDYLVIAHTASALPGHHQRLDRMDLVGMTLDEG
jgi:hypothetical protein